MNIVTKWLFIVVFIIVHVVPSKIAQLYSKFTKFTKF